MDRIVIEGGSRLHGHLPISGSKNACLPLMVAGLLTDEPVILHNVPQLADTRTLADLLQVLGCRVTPSAPSDKEDMAMSLRLHTPDIIDTTAPYELVSRMRAGFWVLGALLARCGQARVSLPGGCAIGTRPVNFYLQGLAAMGAEIEVSEGYIHASAPSGLKAAHIDLPSVSVGATHVLMMAACLARGTSLITNAACEPEIVALGRCLQAMGAQITGLGTNKLTVEGVSKLTGGAYNVPRDRIEAGAFACAVAATRGMVMLEGVDSDLLGVALTTALERSGVHLQQTDEGMQVTGDRQRLRPVDIVTAPYPGFATDLQAPFMGLMCLADGISHIHETIFENRFMHVQELVRLGADITLQGDMAIVKGVPTLHGAPVMATDLRASLALVIAGLVADGLTIINRVYHLDRGFERLEAKLSACGAKIWREKQT